MFGDYTEGVMANFALSEEDYRWLGDYDIIHSAIWGHAEDAFPRLYADGKITAFDFSDKWDSPYGKRSHRISTLFLPPLWLRMTHFACV